MTNSENEMLLELIEELIEKPLSSLDYNKPLDEVIVEVDGYIDNYILAGKKLIKIHLKQLYHDGVLDATHKLNAAAEQYSLEYKPLVPDKPEQLELLISMQQHNIEDYGLVLRGRLRSSIEARFYREERGS